VERLEPPRFLPAIGQGALGIETLEVGQFRKAAATLDDPTSHTAVVAERAFLAAMQGGCLAPIGAWGRLEAPNRLVLDGVALSPDGRQRTADRAEGAPFDAISLGEKLAEALLKKGAGVLYIPARGL
jgi:hydroxymethylbilane synthase